MSVKLVDALQDTLANWQDDLPTRWRTQLSNVSLGFDQCSSQLSLEHWEPIFPTRKHQTFPGEPDGAHMLRAFDGISPDDVRCVLLGQDPYPSPGFATGRAFEVGDVAQWCELDKMFTKSIRVFMQQICHARTENPSYARSFSDWPNLLADIESEAISLQSPDQIAAHWVDQGVLLLNASLTLSRFQRDIDPHQSEGHVKVWAPLIQAVLKQFSGCDRPIAFLAFGDIAIKHFRDAGVTGEGVFERAHPAYAEAVLEKENPFIAANEFFALHEVDQVSW